VYFAVRDGEAEVVWVKPAIQKGKGPKYEVQARNVSTSGKWKTFDLTTSNRLRFKASDISLELGQVGQTRVRTVLNDGQASPFIASNEFSYAAIEPPPKVLFAFDGPRDALLMVVESGSGAKTNYPSQGFQMRASSDGVNWTLLRYLAWEGESDDPNAAPDNMIPFDRPIWVGPLREGGYNRAEIRTVFNDERLPSRWVPFVPPPL
jgi:hypothetical protein